MSRPVPRFGPLAGILALTFVFAVVAAVAWRAQAWRSPPDSSVGAELFPVTGLLIGGLVLALRPTWWVRVFALTSPALVAIAFNLVWFPAIDGANGFYSFHVQPDNRLAARYLNHNHTTVSLKATHFLLADYVRGKQIRYIAAWTLSRRDLLLLAEPLEILDVPSPGYQLPTAQELWGTYEHRTIGVYTDLKGEEQARVAVITEHAESAEYFVVVLLDGIDFVIPDRVWEREARRQILMGPR